MHSTLPRLQSNYTHTTSLKDAYADMMKLVDISDLGSDEHASWGFKSLYPYT
jgi:hypothetical protein